MKSWQPVSLPVWQKCLNVEVILNSESVISEIRILQKMCEVILISEFMNPEIRIISIFMPFSKAGRLAGFHVEKPLL